MLTEGIVEDDFDQNEDAWCAQRNLEHDLHLAAELGKSLLDRNRELEQALQQIYSTNQEQLLEIEYLAKQVELLRHMNDQHTKVYEQLDVSTRDLEQANKKLVQDERLAQKKINSLTESIDGLQMHVEGLQNQLEALTSTQSERNKQEKRRNLTAHSVSCLKELYNLRHDRPILSLLRCVLNDSRQIEGLWSPQKCIYDRDPEDEHEALLGSVRTLTNQLAAEKSRREAAESESQLTAEDKRSLESRLVMLAGCRDRQAELEVQVEQLRLLWRSDCAKRKPVQLLLPDTIFFTSDDKAEVDPAELEEVDQKYADDDHEQMCVRRAEVVKRRGILLLNEVDAQYSALQVKYDALLQRCQQANVGLTHKSVQTPRSPSASSRPRECTLVPEEPEYKILFKEIFTCIQKTKEDLHDNKLVRDASAV
ncbi:cerebellar degeneration-related protein 2 isoform X2 [Corythoichthys intestinalis]|uniref:cerebellar degeneration-related protein 2 isoform X2 n=1 Tax=Corythoichthys intestinalis TaxID=161448 RepID=UPI0025A5CF23|nr:cerebellar degeneration-related protein 2 isoform X2 [Corythoichthys intestinalis]